MKTPCKKERQRMLGGIGLQKSDGIMLVRNGRSRASSGDLEKRGEVFAGEKQSLVESQFRARDGWYETRRGGGRRQPSWCWRIE